MLDVSLEYLASKYDHFLVDQFGVLLDGVRTYPGAADALRELKQQGKTIVILSNSGKRSRKNAQRLEGLGIRRNCYSHLVTSGEVAHKYLSERSSEIVERRRVFVIASDNDRSSIHDLALNETDKVQSCDLVLISGSPGDSIPLDFYRKMLRPAADRGIPAVCTNPDVVMLTENGTTYGAGRIAEIYMDLGGRVEFIGKPHPAVYRFTHSLIGCPSKDRVLCLGDSPTHDVAGGRGFGFRTALVRTGVHSNDNLAHLTSSENSRPNYVLQRFCFSRSAV